MNVRMKRTGEGGEEIRIKRGSCPKDTGEESKDAIMQVFSGNN